MKRELYDYDIFPMVFPVGEATEITVKPLGKHSAFTGDYRIVVQRLDAGSLGYDFAKWNHTDYDVTPCEDGALRFTYTADVECEHFVRIYKDDRRILQLPVYALAEDLACRIPLRGDLHMHTCRSDGHEDPATVCANYRKIGYDFIVVTDHNRYYPSLEARNTYKDADITLNILPGEEVHVPLTSVHIVNAGGTFSVNGLIETSPNYTETNGSIEGRSLDGNA
ncbi:MAG: PHP domain-containing protein, partial [Clostridia bacterium]|nr:PHP domain-containing protein [Clostridia bacterium]